MADNIGDFLRFYTERYDRANPKRLEDLIGPLGNQITQLNTTIMENLSVLRSGQESLNTKLDSILTAVEQSGGLSAAEADTVLAQMQSFTDQLKRLGGQ